MAEKDKKQTKPFSLRLTFDERAELDKAAAGMPVGEYIRERLFDGAEAPRRTRGKFPVQDHKELAQVLALLGQSRRASNMNQLAKAANSGSLPVTPDVEAELKRACEEIREIRAHLLKALGLQTASASPRAKPPGAAP
ncbi:MAG: hypothetical protein AAFQ45_02020 [Pseudomonadota bacterium]